MNTELSSFTARLRERFFVGDDVRSLHSNSGRSEPPHAGFYESHFNSFALELFALQFKYNAVYRRICETRGFTPAKVEHWTQIPAVPTAAFKELDLTGIPPEKRTVVFHSSGTTEQKPSRHFHCAESLAVYEASLWNWFEWNVLRSADDSSARLFESRGRVARAPVVMISLTPLPEQAPHSSLVHMFAIVRQKLDAPASAFFGKTDETGAWNLDFEVVVSALNQSCATCQPSLLLGTAFSFVHLLDDLTGKNLKFQLPAGSRVMETGGYKNRSRTMSKAELHALITERLGVPRENIICEYGMSELSSQAYEVISGEWQGTGDEASFHVSPVTRHFSFPPWARVQVISPETGREVSEGKAGLIRVFDLANVFSVAAIQTEDLGIRRGDGFELVGRAQLAEPRGCSLMNA